MNLKNEFLSPDIFHRGFGVMRLCILVVRAHIHHKVITNIRHKVITHIYNKVMRSIYHVIMVSCYLFVTSYYSSSSSPSCSSLCYRVIICYHFVITLSVCYHCVTTHMLPCCHFCYHNAIHEDKKAFKKRVWGVAVCSLVLLFPRTKKMIVSVLVTHFVTHFQRMWLIWLKVSDIEATLKTNEKVLLYDVVLSHHLPVDLQNETQQWRWTLYLNYIIYWFRCLNNDLFWWLTFNICGSCDSKWVTSEAL